MAAVKDPRIRCRRFKCTIKTSVCISRQGKAADPYLMEKANLSENLYVSCRDCEQGDKVMGRVKEKGAGVKQCKKAGCIYPAKALGYCRKHYDRTYQNRKVMEEPGKDKCKERGCTSPARVKGVCNMHYQKNRRVEKEVEAKCGRCAYKRLVVKKRLEGEMR